MSDIFEQAAQAALRGEQRSRDNDALLYLLALDKGNFDTLGQVLQRAETDPKLEQIIFAIHKELAEEEGIVVSQEELEQAHRMVLHIFKQWEDQKPS